MKVEYVKLFSGFCRDLFMYFVYFGIYIEFLIIELIVCIFDLVKVVKVEGMLVFVIIDLFNLYVVVKFYGKCLDNGIKLIMGLEVCLNDVEYCVILLVMSNVGWCNLIELVLEGFICG